MKRIWLAVALSVVLGASVACGGSDDSDKKPAAPASQPTTAAATSSSASGTAAFTLVGFADHAAPGNFPPPDITATGGTIKSCNPPHLYAFINFKDLAAPKQFVGYWTLNGTALNTQTLNQTASSATSFFEVQNTPQALAAGAYRFQLNVDSATVAQGNFTLAC